MLNEEGKYTIYTKCAILLLTLSLLQLIMYYYENYNCNKEGGSYEFNGVELVENVEIGRMECIK